MSGEDILIVDDEADIRKLIRGILEDEGYKTRSAADAKQAYEEISKTIPDLIVLDIWLQGSEHDGLQILAKVKKDYPNIPILMISGHGTIETAVSSIKQGAYDFIEKPFKSDRLLLMIRRALETAELRRENESLKRKSERTWSLIGNSPAMQELRDIIERVAATNSRILITGEAGVGKEVVARNIHALSPRASAAFHVLSCATLSPERLEVELFGSSETGLNIGILEQANGGTLLLDEVADMPLETQAKIVRVLQEQSFNRVGGQQKVEVDVRIIASTNRDLEAAIEEGKFRQDLYYRLNVVPVRVPSLRERREDIAELLNHFADEVSKQSGVAKGQFSEEAIAKLGAYNWPGNIRQLRNIVERALIMRGSDGQKMITEENLPAEVTGGMISGGNDNSELMGLPLREAREMFERDYLKAQIERFAGNVSKTAEFVGMERSALHRKLKSLQLLDDEKKRRA
jgi:two-component system nitrogen regulation response regulator NtrX